MLTRRHHTGPSGRGGGFFHIRLFVIFIIGFSVLPACSPKIIERIVVQRDTTVVHRRDSILRRDSVWVKEYVKGDTIFIEKYKDRFVYRDRWRDSIRVVRDSVAVERAKEVKVEKPLSAWQRFRIGGFWWLLALAAVGWRKQLLWLIKKAAGLFG